MDRVQSIGFVIAGIGFILFGFKLLKNNSRALYSRKLRLILDNLTNSKLKSSFVGILSGLIMPNATTFVLAQAGASSSGLIDDKKIMTVIFWMNAGCSLLVWFSAFNVSHFIAYLLGMTAIVLAIIKDAKWQIRLEFLLSIFLLFFALQMVKSGSAEIFTTAEIKSIIAISEGSLIFSFLAGTILAALTQSSLLITMIALSLVNSGVFDFPQLVIFIYGTELGICIIFVLISIKITGKAKRVMMGQFVFEIIGVSVFILLFIIELLADIPLVMSWMASMSNDLAHQVANTYVFFNFVTALICTLSLDVIYKYLSKWFPVTDEERRQKLNFISNIKDIDSATGMEMVNKELRSCINDFEKYFDYVAEMNNRNNRVNIDSLRSPFQIIIKETNEVIKIISGELLTGKDSEKILYLQRLSELTSYIEEELSQLITKSLDVKDNQDAERVMTMLLESARTIWLTFMDEINNPSEINLKTILMITGDKSEILSQFRLNNAETIISINKSGKPFELDLHFERLIWLINKYARMIELYRN